jgi:hypothetical protein
MECDQSTDRNASGSEDQDHSDPHFPYRGGPGHPLASQETLKIMHRMLKAKGVKRFRFDFTARFSTPENKFCLELARDIFLKLVECGEYDGLQPHECNPDALLGQLTSYVRDRYVRK